MQSVPLVRDYRHIRVKSSRTKFVIEYDDYFAGRFEEDSDLEMAALSIKIIKYVLLVFIVVAVLCVIPTIPIGYKHINDLVTHPTHKNSMTREQASSAKIVLVVAVLVEFVLLVVTFIGGLKENFCLTLVASVLLILWSLGYMFVVRSSLDLIVLVLNVLTAVIGLILAVLLRSDGKRTATQEGEY